jgi:hypothetical protein
VPVLDVAEDPTQELCEPAPTAVFPVPGIAATTMTIVVVPIGPALVVAPIVVVVVPVPVPTRRDF